MIQQQSYELTKGSMLYSKNTVHKTAHNDRNHRTYEDFPSMTDTSVACELFDTSTIPSRKLDRNGNTSFSDEESIDKDIDERYLVDTNTQKRQHIH